MDRDAPPLLKPSLLLSGSSVLLAVVSILFARRVNYLEYLTVFNVLAIAALVLALAGLVVGLVGLWKTGGRNTRLWMASATAMMIVGVYLTNP